MDWKNSYDVTSAIITSDDYYWFCLYAGTYKTPAVTVKYGEKVLVADTDYTVVYDSNVNAGIASVIVTGKGNYAGEIKKEFTINPSAVAGFTYSARSSSAVALKWTMNY